MKTYTICGSMRFEQEMKDVAFFLETKKGMNILQCIYCNKNLTAEEQQLLSAAHKQKIDISDGIYVLNIGGYIGDATAEEIAYAKMRGKEIRYHCIDGHTV